MIFIFANSVPTGVFNLTDIFNLIQNIWIWTYNTMIHLSFKIGSYSFNLLSLIIGIFVLGITISVAFNSIKNSINSSVSGFSSYVDRNENKKKYGK